MSAVHQRCLLAQGTWSCATCACLNPDWPAPRLQRMRRGARGWRCGRRAYRRALRRDGRRRPIAAVDAGRVATRDWQRRGCGGTMHLLYVASAHVVLYVVFWDLGGRLTAPRLQRRVGVDMGGSVTCVRGGCAHAQTQAVHAVNVPPNSHAPSKRPAHTYARARARTHAHAHARARTRARTHTRMRALTPRPVVLSSDTRADARGGAWCDYMRQAREKARRRRVEPLVEAERASARLTECLHFCLVLCDKTMLAHAGGDR